MMNRKIEIGGRIYPVLRVTKAGVHILKGFVQLIPQGVDRWLEITPENPGGSYIKATVVE